MLFVASPAIAFERMVYRIEQDLISNGFKQKIHGAGFHRLNGHRHIAVPRQTNDRQMQVETTAITLEKKATFAPGPDIEHDATYGIRSLE